MVSVCERQGAVEGERPVEAAIFDLDGTLIDTKELILISMRHATREVLHEEISDERLLSLVGQPLVTEMEDLSPEHAEELLAVYRQYNHAIHDSMVREFPGIDDMLEELKAYGVRMAVVTSKMHRLAERGLELFDYRRYFEFLVGPDDCEGHKPDPAPITFAVEKMGLEPAACLYIGDSPFDIEAGNRAGCRTVAVHWGIFSVERLRDEHPRYEATCPKDITDIVKRLRP